MLLLKVMTALREAERCSRQQGLILSNTKVHSYMESSLLGTGDSASKIKLILEMFQNIEARLVDEVLCEASCEFVMSVLLQDFPPEVFLQVLGDTISTW